MTRGRGKDGGGHSRRQNITYTPIVPSFLRAFVAQGEKRDVGLDAQAASASRAIRQDRRDVLPTKEKLEHLQREGSHIMQAVDEADDVSVQPQEARHSAKSKDVRVEEEEAKKNHDEVMIPSMNYLPWRKMTDLRIHPQNVWKRLHILSLP